jgi:signal transduction histidine kinase
MPRTIQSTFFEPLVHGLDVILAKAERAMAREGANPDLDAVAANHHRDLVNLPRIAEQVAAQFEDGAQARSVHLFVDVAPDALMVGDSCELHLAVEHLVAAVIAATPCGGWVLIAGAASHGVITLTFSSHSPGGPSEIGSHFPLGAGAARQSLPSPGSRSSLSEVAHILSDHGGRLEVSNQPGEGSRYEIRLPVG